jgi:hypothetical protein
MPFSCPKCSKVIKSKQKLTSHLNKKNPCDKVCQICNVKLPHQRAFNAHRKTHTVNVVANVVEENSPVKELAPVKKVLTLSEARAKFFKTKTETPREVTMLKELFPLEDFQWETIVAEREEMRTINDEIVIEKVKYERTVIRGKSIEKLIKSGVLNEALKALNEYSDKPSIMKQLMYHVHGQPSEPHFHSLCRTDLNRDIISYYSRPDPDQESGWIKAPFKDALNRLNTHARHLTMFMIQAGINALEVKYWTIKKCVVFMFVANEYQTLLYRDNADLIYKRQPCSKEFIDCGDEHEHEVNKLISLVEDKKEEVMQEIKNESLDEKTWDDFFIRA